MKETFTALPDKWKALDLESRFILAYMLRFQESGKKFFMKTQTFYENTGIPPKTFQRRIKVLKANGVVKVIGYIQNAIPIYLVDKNEADFVGKHGLDKSSSLIGQNVQSDKTNCPDSVDKLSTSIGQTVQHTKEDTRQVTKENTKEGNQPESFSFESFKENKPTKKQMIDGIDLELFARNLD